MDNKKKALLAGGGLLGGLLVADKSGAIVKGIAIGIVCILLAMLLTFNSVGGVKEVSNDVAAIPLVSVNDLDGQRGMVKAFGTISTESSLSFELVKCAEVVCLSPELLLSEENLAYYKITLQRFEVIRKVEEQENSGNNVSEKVTYKNEWVTKSEKEQWANLKIGSVKINPVKARTLIDTEREELKGVYIEGLTQLETFGRQPAEDEPAFGTTRALVTYLPLDDREYTVVGELRSDGFSAGDPFIFTDLSDSQLVSRLGGEESTSRWLMRFVAFVLLTFGFTSILSPILVFTDMIPLAGKAARSAATLVSAIAAGIIVLATVFLLNYWWAIALIIILGLLGFAFIASRKTNTNTEQKS